MCSPVYSESRSARSGADFNLSGEPWDMRNRQHLFSVCEREIDHYWPADWDRAARTLHGLMESLNDHWQRTMPDDPFWLPSNPRIAAAEARCDKERH